MASADRDALYATSISALLLARSGASVRVAARAEPRFSVFCINTMTWSFRNRLIRFIRAWQPLAATEQYVVRGSCRDLRDFFKGITRWLLI